MTAPTAARRAALLALGATLLLAPPPRAPRAAPSPTPRPVWERVVVLGASASAGYRTGRRAGRDVSLARVLDRMIRREHRPVVDAAAVYFFASPRYWAARECALAREADPTLVVALDFLFWFGYGVKEREEDRLRDLEEGLRYLERFDCPVLVSLLPDMRRAIGRMLFSSQVPSRASLRVLNARIRRWAASRESVILVPMKGFIDGVRAGKPVRVGRVRWPARATYLFLQSDDLHPTVEGLAALAHLSLHTLSGELPGLPAGVFDLSDPLAVARGFLRTVRAGAARMRE